MLYGAKELMNPLQMIKDMGLIGCSDFLFEKHSSKEIPDDPPIPKPPIKEPPREPSYPEPPKEPPAPPEPSPDPRPLKPPIKEPPGQPVPPIKL